MAKRFSPHFLRLTPVSRRGGPVFPPGRAPGPKTPPQTLFKPFNSGVGGGNVE